MTSPSDTLTEPENYTCTVVPFPCDELIKQAAQLSDQEWQFFVEEVGRLRHENNNPERELQPVVSLNDEPLEINTEGFGE